MSPAEPTADVTNDETELEAMRKAKLPPTDYGNAERLVIDHGADVRHAPGIGWLVYDGCRWCRDDDGAITRRAKSTVRALREAAARIKDPKDSTAAFKFACTSEQRARLEAMIALAATEEKVLARADDLDSDPFLFNVENCTIDLRTGKPREHRREDLLTKLAPVTFKPDATCPRWQTFIEEITEGDPEKASYLQRAAGYSLTGDTTEQCLFLVDGRGENGKTTFIETLADTLGDYAAHADSATFMTRRGHGASGDIARLRGARLVVSAEVENDAQLAEVLVKEVTGGGKIVARHLYSPEFEFRPAFKIWITANKAPKIDGDDHAIWRRIKRVPFNAQIANPDKHLPQALRAELPGILAWAVRGCLEWQAQGLKEPAAVRDATQDYRVTQDTLGAFLTQHTRKQPGASTGSQELHSAYARYCQSEGATPITTTAFGRALPDRGYVGKTTNKGKVWTDIEITESGGSGTTSRSRVAGVVSSGE